MSGSFTLYFFVNCHTAMDTLHISISVFSSFICCKFHLKGKCHFSSVIVNFLPFLAVLSVHPVCEGN